MGTGELRAGRVNCVPELFREVWCLWFRRSRVAMVFLWFWCCHLRLHCAGTCMGGWFVRHVSAGAELGVSLPWCLHVCVQGSLGPKLCRRAVDLPFWVASVLCQAEGCPCSRLWLPTPATPALAVWPGVATGCNAPGLDGRRSGHLMPLTQYLVMPEFCSKPAGFRQGCPWLAAVTAPPDSCTHGPRMSFKPSSLP